jgi:hypothetical protein
MTLLWCGVAIAVLSATAAVLLFLVLVQRAALLQARIELEQAQYDVIQAIDMIDARGRR